MTLFLNPQSRIILGTDFFSPDIQPKVNEFLNTFIHLGGLIIDTAENYGGGSSEAAIGHWLKESGARSKIRILTKGAHPYHGRSRLSEKDIMQDLEGSLSRLQTDVIDYYALHRDDPDTPVSDIISTLNKYIKAGNILEIGASNWSIERIEEANRYAEENNLAGFTFSSINISLARANKPRWPGAVSINDDIHAWHSATQLPVFSWSSLAGGFMSGIYQQDMMTNQEIAEVFYNADNWLKLQRAKELALRHQCHVSQIALAYVLHQSFPTGAIVAAHHLEELQMNMQAAHIILSPEEIQYLELAAETVHSPG